MHRATAPSEKIARTLNGRHVLAILIGFFGCVFGVNGYFIFRSLSTYTGIVAEEPYRKGLGYNSRIAADDRQIALNWRVELVMTTGAVTVTLHDASGRSIDGKNVTLRIGRPSTRSLDRTFALHETTPGDYASATDLLAPGNWIVEADVRGAESGETDYRIRRRIWLRR
jgi:nitrogen fixation protein FixH